MGSTSILKKEASLYLPSGVLQVPVQCQYPSVRIRDEEDHNLNFEAARTSNCRQLYSADTNTLVLAYVCVLQISLGRILKAVVAFKGLMIEWVVVKGHGETLDLWTESRHKVFRKVTENAHAAMLHFSSPTLPELAVRSFMVSPVIQSVCYSLSHFAVYRSLGQDAT